MTRSATLGSSVRRVYRRAAAPLGRAKLARMVASGLPLPFERPLEFLFSGRLTPEEREVARRVEGIREEVAGSGRTFEVVNRHGERLAISAAELARRSSVNAEWGTFLHLCATAFGARTIVELGSCAGISGCYLASSPGCERFVTVDASPRLAALARENLARAAAPAEVVNALFDDALDTILPGLDDGIGLAYVDGHHTYEATLHYFERLRPHLAAGALVVFDDIHLSEGMWRAWQHLRARQGFSHTVAAGRLGLCLWDGSASPPAHHDLCPYLGCIRRSA